MSFCKVCCGMCRTTSAMDLQQGRSQTTKKANSLQWRERRT